MSHESAPRIKGASSILPTAPTASQLAELKDAMVTASELLRIYATISRHPRVKLTPGSNEIFATCREQMRHDLMMLEEQIDMLGSHVIAPLAAQDEYATENEMPVAPREEPMPDPEPAAPDRTVFESVRSAFHVEDFLRQQLEISVQTSRERKHLKLELQLKMVLLSARQRCALLEERYGFARGSNVIFQGVRKQTTRFLSRLQGEQRHDID